MSLAQKILITLGLAVGTAGCASGPSWDEPKKKRPLIVEGIEKTTLPGKQEAKEGYKLVPVEVTYKFDTGATYALFSAISKAKNLDQFQQMKLASEIGGIDGIVDSKEVSKYITEKKIPGLTYEHTEETTFTYKTQLPVVEDQKERLQELMTSCTPYQKATIVEFANGKQLSKTDVDIAYLKYLSTPAEKE